MVRIGNTLDRQSTAWFSHLYQCLDGLPTVEYFAPPGASLFEEFDHDWCCGLSDFKQVRLESRHAEGLFGNSDLYADFDLFGAFFDYAREHRPYPLEAPLLLVQFRVQGMDAMLNASRCEEPHDGAVVDVELFLRLWHEEKSKSYWEWEPAGWWEVVDTRADGALAANEPLA